MKPARTCRVLGTVAYREEAEALLAAPGEAALVYRGVLRSLVMRCPDGCGETLVVNLDRRAGKAWRIDQRGGGTSLYPSVWRDGGCGSHFIVWRGHVIWCDRFEDENEEPEYDTQLETRIHACLDAEKFRNAEELAEEVDETPWDVARALRLLKACGKAETGKGNRRDLYRLKSRK